MLQPKAKKKNTSPLIINIFNIIWREVKDDIFPSLNSQNLNWTHVLD